MSLTPPNVIGGMFVYKLKVIMGYERIMDPKMHPNILWKEKSKEIRDSMKVEDGNVHHKRYNGHYTKQWIRILKATWTSPILRRRSTCQASSCRAFFMKDDVKIKVPNRTPKTLILSDEVVNWDGVLKYDGKLKGDHATHFWGWIERPIACSSI